MEKFYADYTKCTMKVVNDLINKKYRGGVKKFILYPFGDIGRRVKSILNVFMGIQEYCIVDNYLARKYDSIKSLDDLTEKDIKDALVLITSDSDEVYDDIRKALYDRVPRKQCVELFPKPVLVHRALNIGDIPNDLRYHLMRLASVQTAEYIIEKMPTVTMYPNRYKLMEHIFLGGITGDEGLFLEFGVRSGTSIDFIAAYNPTKTIYGFDSFEGLPEAWNFYAPAGTFDLGGVMPEVNRNVELIKGWFDKTLPGFVAKHDGKCSFIHIDSDIYSSAKTVFEILGERITHGTVIEFDEYFNRPNWQNGEFKAFHEFIDRYKLEYEYIGFCNNGPQCAVKIK